MLDATRLDELGGTNPLVDVVTCDSAGQHVAGSLHPGWNRGKDSPRFVHMQLIFADFLLAGRAILCLLCPRALDLNLPADQGRHHGFHSDAALCGTCHDVSNPVVGSLTQGAGTPERQASAS